MYPKISIGSIEIPTFSLCAAIGIAVMTLSIILLLRKREKAENEMFFIIPKLMIALGFGFFGAVLFDALFKIEQNGGFKISGIMFYGGVICGLSALGAMIAIFKKNSALTLSEWFDLLTVPFICFHAIGRVGCFLGGCCYGAETDGAFGVVFPDNPAAGIYHNGQKVLPTQLFEAAGLCILAVALVFVKKRRFSIYMLAYAIMRFMLEFLRGDDRGAGFFGLSPSQSIAILCAVFALALLTADIIKSRDKALKA